MPQVTIRRPFGELDLGDQVRLEPHAVFHLFLGQGPLRPLLLRQVSKRASVDHQTLEPTRHFPANLRHEPISHLGGIKKPVGVVVADDQRVKRITRCVAANDELLPPVDLVLDPCAGSLTGFVNRSLRLATIPSNPNSLATRTSSLGVASRLSDCVIGAALMFLKISSSLSRLSKSGRFKAWQKPEIREIDAPPSSKELKRLILLHPKSLRNSPAYLSPMPRKSAHHQLHRPMRCDKKSHQMAAFFDTCIVGRPTIYNQRPHPMPSGSRPVSKFSTSLRPGTSMTAT
jgi:hypothetical protein